MKKSNLFIQLFLFGLITLLSVNCSDDEGPAPVKPQPSGKAMKERFAANLEGLKQKFTIDAAVGGSVTGEKGTMLNFSPNTFLNQNGDAVTGDIEIELVEILDKSNMLLTNKSTNGRLPNGDVSTLISGGEFFVNALQDGEALELNGEFGITVPTDEIDDQMALFNGVKNDCDDTGDNCDIIWEEDQKNELMIREIDGLGGMGYQGFRQEFGWTNIDRWYNDPRPKTTIHVDVPEGFDNKNCSVYLSYVGEPNVLASFDTYDELNELFTEHYGLIPIGLEVHFIFVTVIDDNWEYAVQSTTITEDHVEVIGTLTSASQEELITIIENLN